MHSSESIVFALFLIFTGAAITSTIALWTRQSMLVAYMILGMIIGPWGLHWITQSHVIEQTGDVGIIFLLFLLGLNLHPQKLVQMFTKTVWVALVSSLIFAAAGYVISQLFGYNTIESLVIGLAMMFSSTIIGLKLLPTTVLHHQHIGELVISVLLLQDIIAILALLVLQGIGSGQFSVEHFLLIIIALPMLMLVAFLAERYVLIKLLAKFDRVHEYIFLLSIGWCLSMAEFSAALGLSAEIGAFIAGVALGAHPISRYISENLKPLRDFFLVTFFFSIGAQFNVAYLSVVIIPALVLSLIMIVLKPWVFKLLFSQVKEPAPVSWEIGWRLGQISEFSLLIAYFASSMKLIGDPASYLIQATTIITFIASSYIVVLRFPSPLAFSERLRRD